MSICDDWIKKITCRLPDQCSTVDLINIGIFTSVHSACCARKAGSGPGYFKLGKRIMYPKESVIQWLSDHKHENSQ